MPLDKSGSAQSVGKNYKTEVEAGKPKKQALAIALSEQRAHAKGSRKAKLEAEYEKHMKSAEEKGETKKESKKAEMSEY
jgi:hypothetical protein